MTWVDEEFADFVAIDCAFVKYVLSLLGNVHGHLDLLWNLRHKIKFVFSFICFKAKFCL